VNVNSGSRKIPATTVIASPKIGIQDSSRDHFPYRRYQSDARFNRSSVTGNHRLPLKRSMPLPRNQFVTLPSVLPMLATTRRSQSENFCEMIIPTRTGSD